MGKLHRGWGRRLCCRAAPLTQQSESQGEHLGWGREGALTLWAGEAIVGPAVGVAIDAQQRVLLLHPEPGVAVLNQVHDFPARVSQVGLWEQRSPVRTCHGEAPTTLCSNPLRDRDSTTAKRFPEKP